MNQEAIIELFCRVLECDRCSHSIVLRDSFENIPQPGYIGTNYEKYRILLIGQNPGVCPPSMKNKDFVYMEALKNLWINKDKSSYDKLYQILLQFVPEWPVQKNYFPLHECGLGLEDIGYCNIVRCRTSDNKTPSIGTTQNCINEHLIKFIDEIVPKVIVFIGKWAYIQLNTKLKELPIKLTYMNRDRSLSSDKRDLNRNEVIKTVLSSIRNDPST